MRKSLIVSGLILASFGFACGDASTPGASKSTTTTQQVPATTPTTAGGATNTTVGNTATTVGSTNTTVGNTATTVGSTNTTLARGLVAPVTAPSPQPDPVQGSRRQVCTSTWGGAQCDLNGLAAPAANNVYLAHGDVAGNGGCAVWVWKTTAPSGLSNATWQLYVIGAPDDTHMADAIGKEQLIAGKGDPKACPVSFK